MPNLITSTRQCPPSETLSAIQPLFPKYDIHGYADHTPNGITFTRSIEIFRDNPRSGYMNLGKGFGLEAALVSGYMEAIEMSTIEHSPEVQLLMISDIIANDKNALFYSEADRKVCFLESIDPSHVYYPVISGIDLLTSRKSYGFCDDHFLSQEKYPGKVYVSTNGLASGNTVAEAQLHAIYEIIERHIGLLAFQSAENVKVLELQEIPSPLQEAIYEVYSLGMQCDFFQLGQIFDVYVVQCTIVFTDSSNHEQPKINFGWGAHHNITIAVSRALSETVQIYATRKAVRNGSIPQDHLKGGFLVSAKELSLLGSDSSRYENDLYSKLLSCSTKPLSLDFENDETLASTSESLDRVIRMMKQSDISHLFSWTLSPDHHPFAVVKCVIPEFKTFIP
jgi:YcaO-like protein with predicted kinase domain